MVGLFFFYYEVQKPAAKNVANMEVAMALETDDLIKMFQDNKEDASNSLIEKVVQVKGQIKEISFINERYTFLLTSENFPKNFVMCEMAPGNLRIEEFQVGDTLELRGICKGYLLDVIMLNCVPINENTNP